MDCASRSGRFICFGELQEYTPVLAGVRERREGAADALDAAVAIPHEGPVLFQVGRGRQHPSVPRRQWDFVGAREDEETELARQAPRAVLIAKVSDRSWPMTHRRRCFLERLVHDMRGRGAPGPAKPSKARAERVAGYLSP